MTTTSTAQPGRAEPRRETLLTDFSVAPITAEQTRRARLAVCARSRDAAEARQLLEALGLL